MKYKIKKAVDGSLLNRINALIPQQQIGENIIENIPDTYTPIDFGKKTTELLAQSKPAVINPKEDFKNKYSTFNQAFSAANKAGLKEFIYNGKPIVVKFASEKPQVVTKAKQVDNTQIQSQPKSKLEAAFNYWKGDAGDDKLINDYQMHRSSVNNIRSFDFGYYDPTTDANEYTRVDKKLIHKPLDYGYGKTKEGNVFDTGMRLSNKDIGTLVNEMLSTGDFSEKDWEKFVNFTTNDEARYFNSKNFTKEQIIEKEKTKAKAKLVPKKKK